MLWSENMEGKVMELGQAQAAVEALLFTMGKAVALKDIAAVLEHDEETVRKIIHQMMDTYKMEKRGIQIIELEDSFQMCTDPAYYDYIVRLTHQPKKHTLTDAMLEALSIIAYKQPVTRSMVEQIRGVSSDYVINRLIEYNLVMEVGRLDAPGKPILFGTTEEFLRTFGVKSQDELPVIDPVKVAEFKTEAEEEAALKIET
mgnify:CR=1 FL=1